MTPNPLIDELNEHKTLAVWDALKKDAAVIAMSNDLEAIARAIRSMDDSLRRLIGERES